MKKNFDQKFVPDSMSYRNFKDALISNSNGSCDEILGLLLVSQINTIESVSLLEAQVIIFPIALNDL